MNINGDKYPDILKSNINFFYFMISLKDIAIDFLNNNNNNWN
jgi:hypothetical protein